jgi:hypothetical protein
MSWLKFANGSTNTKHTHSCHQQNNLHENGKAEKLLLFSLFSPGYSVE